MHILADGRTFEDGQLKLSDFSPEGQVEIVRAFRDLLLLGRRISARQERERVQAAAGRRNEHIIIKRPERQQGKERGDGRRKGRKETERETLGNRRK